MEMYFTDRKFNVLGMASTSLPNALKLYNDKETEEIDTGVSMFEGTIMYNPEKNLVTTDIVEVGNFILFQNEHKESKWYTITRTELDRSNKELYFYSEDAGLDLLNEVVGPYKASKAYPASHYIEQFAYDSGFKIGINEIRHLERNLEWEGEMTATKRLLSVATQFDNSEISYSFVINGMQLVEKNINIYKKRGNDLNINLRLNHEINNIVTTESIENLITALFVSGGTLEGEDQPVTLKGFSYDDGRFYVGADGVIRDRESIRLWSRYLTNTESPDKGHIFGYRTDYTSTDQRTLCLQGINYLKKMCEIERNYEVDIAILPENVRVGDRVNIVDEAGKLYLNSRILKLEHSYSAKSSVAVLGEFILQSSGISERLQELADRINNIPRGDTFFPWVRYADDDQGNGISAMPLGKRYMAIRYVVNNATTSDDPKDYIGLWSLIQGENGQPGSPGENGSSLYTWKKYADNVSGGNMSDNPKGKMYLGLALNKETPNASNVATDYTWSAMYDEERLNELALLINKATTIYKQPGAPVGKTGDMWWQTDINNAENVIAMYVNDGGKWIPQRIDQSTLNIVSLNAVNISGSVINGSSFVNAFDANFNGANLEGVTVIEDGKYTTSYAVKGTTQTGLMEVNPLTISNTIYDSSGNVLSGYEISSGSLMLKNGGKTVALTAADLYDSGWVTLPIQNGANAQVLVRKKFGIVTIDFWVNTPKFGSGGANTIATLPAEFRFYKDFSVVVGNNSLTGKGILRIMANGSLLMWSGDNPTASYSSVTVYPSF
jgi:phage minor structural protein